MNSERVKDNDKTEAGRRRTLEGDRERENVRGDREGKRVRQRTVREA